MFIIKNDFIEREYTLFTLILFDKVVAFYLSLRVYTRLIIHICLLLLLVRNRNKVWPLRFVCVCVCFLQQVLLLVLETLYSA
jgi:hypothetical protein